MFLEMMTTRKMRWPLGDFWCFGSLLAVVTWDLYVNVICKIYMLQYYYNLHYSLPKNGLHQQSAMAATWRRVVL